MTNQPRINIMEDTFVSPQKSTEPPRVQYGAVSERLIALLIDVGVIFIPAVLATSFFFRFFVKDQYDFTLFSAALILMNVLFIAYETIFSCANRVTLGKALLGLAVVKQDESGPLSFGRAFLRAVGYYVSAGLFGVGFLWAYLDTRHRALHDLLGGSVVVRVRPQGTGEKIILRLCGSILVMAFAWILYNQIIGGSHWYQDYQVMQAKQFLRKIGRLEETHNRLYGAYTNDFLRLVLLSGDPVQFQRDMNKVLSPKGFKIGVKENGYKISARAKDNAKTTVFFERSY